MKIPFSLPVIDAPVIAEMNDTLSRTGWLTTGPKTRELEEEIAKLVDIPTVLCVNSWTSGAMLMLRWLGVGAGDEVIIPAYTYSATALCVMNLGATPVMVDVKDDFTIDPQKIREAITQKTKAIIPVDMGGYPADYKSIYSLVKEEEIQRKYTPNSPSQKQLGRIFILSDAAHSIGATYEHKPVGQWADASVFSLHSVKNITTGEGGAIVLNLPSAFDKEAELKFLRALSLNGQNKSAFEKNQLGGWRYDILAQGLKVNMPDLCASVGLAQIRRYKSELLPERKKLYLTYVELLSKYSWALIPPYQGEGIESSYHLFLLRIKDISEARRDAIIQFLSKEGIGVNVHYIPMPTLTLFKEKGYRIENYPTTWKLYVNEISLPLYNALSVEKIKMVVNIIVKAYNSTAYV